MSENKLYHWHSVALASYSSGDIVVCASSVKLARVKVLAKAKSFIKDVLIPYFNPSDDDDIRQFNEYMDKFKKDIEKEPTTKDIHFIMGSD